MGSSKLRQILLLGLVQFIISTSFTQTQRELAYPNMDATLVEIWQQAERGYHRHCTVQANRVSQQWKYVEEDLANRPENKELIEDFSISISHLIAEFPRVCERGDLAEISGYAYHLLWEFRMLRFFLNEHGYTLDVLWVMYDVHDEIWSIVHDDMFGLLSWSEFMNRVDEMSNLWDQYSSITGWNSGTVTVQSENDVLLYEAANKVEECLSYFIASLDTGYQGDFVLPCDELGAAIDNLLLMHAFVNASAIDAYGNNKMLKN